MDILRRIFRFLFPRRPLRFVPTHIRFGLCAKDGWQPVYLFKWNYAENRMNYYACVACGVSYGLKDVTEQGTAIAIMYDELLPREKRRMNKWLQQYARREACATIEEGAA